MSCDCSLSESKERSVRKEKDDPRQYIGKDTLGLGVVAGEEAAAAVEGFDQDSLSAHSSLSLISSVTSQQANHWPWCLK